MSLPDAPAAEQKNYDHVVPVEQRFVILSTLPDGIRVTGFWDDEGFKQIYLRDISRALPGREYLLHGPSYKRDQLICFLWVTYDAPIRYSHGDLDRYGNFI